MSSAEYSDGLAAAGRAAMSAGSAHTTIVAERMTTPGGSADPRPASFPRASHPKLDNALERLHAADLAEPCAAPAPPELRKAIDEFNDGEFFEQHETLETLWRATPGEVRHLYEGILQVGVGFHHLFVNHNFRGAAVKLDHGIRLLGALPAACHGVDVGRLCREAGEARALLVQLGPDRIADFDRSRVPRVHFVNVDEGSTPPSAALKPPRASAPAGATPRDLGRSRVTATVRLLIALWLIGSGLWTLADPQRAADLRGGAPVAALLPMAGISFALGIFLLTGFMSRVAGLFLAWLSLWELANVAVSPLPVLFTAVGAYFVLRGGGTWAMDVYVQKMQDRVRRREAAERALS